MYLLRRCLAHLVLGFCAFPWLAQAQVASAIAEQPQLRAQLLSEVSAVAAGDSFTVAVKLMPDQGWHTYWINPGDSGLATTLAWQLPSGSEAGAIQWPIAHKFRIGPLANYGFEGDTYLLTDISVPTDYAANDFTVAVRADWLVCEDYCIPGFAEFSLTLPVTDATTVAPNHREAFATARAQLPEQADWPAAFDIQAKQVTIAVQHGDVALMAQDPSFYAFVGAGELVEHAADGTVFVSDDTVFIQRPQNTFYSGVAEQIPLLLVTDQRAVLITANQQAQGQALMVRGQPVVDTTEALMALPLMLLFAVLGGLMLNLMPCVFPVLSLKALSLANSGDQRLSHALWYSAGVIISFLAIAAVLLALRASGAALGWGFQLQNPWLIAAMSLLFVAIGLNLSGLYQVATRLMSLGSSSQPQHGPRGSFATGVLAVVVASPCTAPFMGVALGFAIAQPPVVALSVFAALGFGLALPFLLIAWIPALANRLPRPGLWMERFKQWMAIPMYLTAVWLVWVFGRQAGVDSMALLLIAAVLLATMLWWLGLRQLQPQPSIGGGLLTLVLMSLSLLALAAALQFAQTPSSKAQTADSQENWQPWSAAQLADLQQNGQPVFVNMTADWCITCLANEKVALDTNATRALFEQHNIAYLKGDWTLQDPAITEYLSQFSRNGVPLYVLYWPGQEPQVLPQLLTPAIVRERVTQSISATP
jgi:thiol:disulfide interchange protein